MLKTETGKPFDISQCNEIAAGGEGKIYEHYKNKDRVIKVYHTVRKPDFAKHLKLLSKLPKAFVTPIDLYYDDSGNVAGFDMDYINFNDYFLFNNLFNKGFCNTHGITKAVKVRILDQLRECLTELHDKLGIVVGDLNQYNIFFAKTCTILFVDCDSFQSHHNPHSGVLLDEIRDWTTRDITPATDAYAFDILSFWATTFVHPFKWVAKGNTETLEQRVRLKKSILSKAISDIKIPPLYDPPDVDLAKQFNEIFSMGRRYMVLFAGKYVQTATVVKQAVSSLNMNIKELYDNVKNVFVSDLMMSVELQTQWCMVETKMTGTVREVYKTDPSEKYDLLIPSDPAKPCAIAGGVFTAPNDLRRFTNPVFYFTDGYLSVVDYAKNELYNYDFTESFGIGKSVTAVFAKSIVFRNTPIQNFGGSVYLNVPYKNRYTLIKAPKGIKDAYFSKGYYAAECKVKNKTRFVLSDHKKPADFGMDLDYLPHFAVKTVKEARVSYDLLFLPDNGCINVYKEYNLMATLDMPNCTRDSKLYSNQSGILLLENNVLYLLNTK